MDYILLKEKDDTGRRLYTVLDETGRVVGQRISRSDYVACLVQETNTTARITPTWFRKPDVIGKGVNANLVHKPGYKVAHWFGQFNRSNHV